MAHFLFYEGRWGLSLTRIEELNQLLTPIVEAMGFEYVGCEYLPQQKNAILRLFVDREGGLTIDHCVEVNRQVSAVLDVEECIASSYTLEVSSPGVERPLFTLEHFRRFIGHKVWVSLHSPIDGRRRFTGILQQVSESLVFLEWEEMHWELPFADIEKAHLVVDFD